MEAVLCYEGKNGSCLKTVYPLTMRVFLYMILGAVEVLTVFGNLLVIITVAHFKQLHTPTNYLVLSLAVADLLLGMFPQMVQCVETCWYFGDFFCKIFNSAGLVLCTASIINLSFISIERYYAVCHPLKYRSKITIHSTLIMISISWGVSAMAGLGIFFPNLNIWGIEELYYSHVSCEGGCIFFQSAVSGTVSSILSFYIPGILMLCLYLKIFLVAQRQVRSIHNTKCQSSARVEKSQGKATKTLAIIVGVFLSCWTPFFTCYVIDGFISYSTPYALVITFLWIGYLNSTVNPLVYGFFYSWFRRALTMIISGQIFLLERRYPARRKPGVPFWSQAQEEDPSASAWWPGLPWSPAGHSPKKLRGEHHLLFSVPWAHHPREKPRGSGALPERWQ